MPSPLLTLPRAVAGNGQDAEVAAHYGSFNGEQRTLAAGDGFVDLSHRGVFTITGPDRLTYLHAMTTQHTEHLEPGVATEALLLSPQGHVEHHFRGVDDGEVFTGHTEPGMVAALVEFLDKMRFMMRVELADVTDQLAVAWRPVSPGEPVETPGLDELDQRGSGKYDVFPRADLEKYAEAAGPACGLWAYDALRIARGEPRFGVDTDHRSIPNEMGWIGPAVHLDKGCYRGQETVARVHTLGRPPRRLTLLHLDGTENRLPTQGSDVHLAPAVEQLRGASREAPVETPAPKAVGFVGSSARHYELGPIALAVLKRNVPTDAALEVDGIPAAQEVVVDPDVGLHVRPNLR